MLPLAVSIVSKAFHHIASNRTLTTCLFKIASRPQILGIRFMCPGVVVPDLAGPRFETNLGQQRARILHFY